MSYVADLLPEGWGTSAPVPGKGNNGAQWSLGLRTSSLCFGQDAGLSRPGRVILICRRFVSSGGGMRFPPTISIGSWTIFALLLAPASVQGQSVVGRWELWSIDGLDPSKAVETQSALDFDVAFGTDTLYAGDSRTGFRLLESTLEVLPGGDYREMKVTVHTTYMTAEAYRRVTGRPYFGSEPLREVSTPDTSIIVGRWTSEADSVLFFLTRDQVSETLVSGLVNVYPTLGIDSLRAVMLSVVDDFRDPEWLGEQMRGPATSSHRLVLHDGSGRTRVYRRPGG